MNQYLLNPLPAPRAPLGVSWPPADPGNIPAAIALMLPGFEMQIDAAPSFDHTFRIQVRRRVEYGELTIDRLQMMVSEYLGASFVDFATKMRRDAIEAYGLQQAFEAEWEIAKDGARQRERERVVALIQATRPWVPVIDPDTGGDTDERERGPLSQAMTELLARVESIR